MLASKHGHAECVELILQHSSEKQTVMVDANGNTDLLTAAGEGHSHCVEMLLQHRETDGSGELPMKIQP